MTFWIGAQGQVTSAKNRQNMPIMTSSKEVPNPKRKNAFLK